MAKKPVAQTLSAAIAVVTNFPVEVLSGNVERVEGGFQVAYKLPRSSKVYTVIIPTSQRISAMIGENGYVVRRALSSEVDSSVLKDVVVYDECTVGVATAKDGSEFEVEVANEFATLSPFVVEEEEEAPAPKKAAAKKKAAPVVEEEDDEEEEEEEEEEEAPAPKKKAVAKPAAKKKAAPVVEDDEEEEDFDDEEEEEEEEVVVPKKKAGAKVVAKPAAKGKKKPAAEEEDDEDFDF